YADTVPNNDRRAADVIWPSDHLDNAGGKLAALFGASDVGLHNGELVAADARHEIGGWDRLGQTGGDQLEQFVADRMAQRVIDRLKVIEIEAMHRKSAAGLNMVERILQMLAEQHPVGQIGQHVVAREMRNLGLGAPPF